MLKLRLIPACLLSNQETAKQPAYFSTERWRFQQQANECYVSKILFQVILVT